MNGFDTKGLDEDAFGEKSGLSGVKAFDAFRESARSPFKVHQLTIISPQPKQNPPTRPQATAAANGPSSFSSFAHSSVSPSSKHGGEAANTTTSALKKASHTTYNSIST